MDKASISSVILDRKDRLIQVVASAHSLTLASDEERAQALALLESEAYYFESLIERTRGTKNDLSDTTEMSQRGLFLEVLSRKLTFSPSMRFVDLAYRNQEISSMENGQRRIRTEKRLTYFPTADGKQFLCMESGSISRVRPVQVVFEGDVFEHCQTNGRDEVKYVDNSHGCGRIVAGFVWVVLPDGSQDFHKMYRADMDRLAQYSERSTGGSGNALYTSGKDGDYDIGFFKNKIVSHALRRYNKKTPSSAFESEETAPPVTPREYEREALQSPAPAFDPSPISFDIPPKKDTPLTSVNSDNLPLW